MDTPVVVTLDGDGGRLRIEVEWSDAQASYGGWARCYLATHAGETYLGAGIGDEVLPRLLTSIDDPPASTSGTAYFGRDAYLVVSLAEAWCGIYVAVDGVIRHVFFLDGLARVVCIGHVTLSPVQWIVWQQRLAAALPRVRGRM